MAKFEFQETEIKGLRVIKPTVFGDNRGFFMEIYHKDEFAKAGIMADFLQDNHSKSNKGVLRGLHLQRENTQAKLVRVTKGSVLDIAVDVREASPTYGKYHKVILSADNKLQFFIPEGFAHGFLTLEDETEFLYKCSDIYNPNSEDGIMWNDPELAIDWELAKHGLAENNLIISEKDLVYAPFAEFQPL